MALVTANGLDVVETRLCTPRTGAWHVDIILGSGDQMVGAVALDVNSGAVELAGTAVASRSGVFQDAARVRVLAGAGGLGVSATPRHYTGTSVAIVLGDLVSAAGERLSPTADAGVLATGLDAWTTSASPIGTLISLLLASAAPGASWRMLADGTLWVGVETWPDAGVDSSLYQVLEDRPEQNTMRIAVDAPLMLAATTFAGRRVSYAEATVGQLGAGVEMRLWFEDAVVVSDADRMRKALFAIAQAAARRTDKIDYGREYPARVVQQSGGTVDVQPDQVNGKDLIPDMAAVPLLLPPGMTVDGVRDGRVTIGWLGGDPSKPYATAFDASNEVRVMTLSVLGQLFLGGNAGAEPAVLGAQLLTYLTTIAAAINAIAPGSASPPPPTLLATKVNVL